MRENMNNQSSDRHSDAVMLETLIDCILDKRLSFNVLRNKVKSLAVTYDAILNAMNNPETKINSDTEKLKYLINCVLDKTDLINGKREPIYRTAIRYRNLLNERNNPNLDRPLNVVSFRGRF